MLKLSMTAFAAVLAVAIFSISTTPADAGQWTWGNTSMTQSTSSGGHRVRGALSGFSGFAGGASAGHRSVYAGGAGAMSTATRGSGTSKTTTGFGVSAGAAIRAGNYSSWVSSGSSALAQSTGTMNTLASSGSGGAASARR